VRPGLTAIFATEPPEDPMLQQAFAKVEAAMQAYASKAKL